MKTELVKYIGFAFIVIGFGFSLVPHVAWPAISIGRNKTLIRLAEVTGVTGTQTGLMSRKLANQMIGVIGTQTSLMSRKLANQMTGT